MFPINITSNDRISILFYIFFLPFALPHVSWHTFPSVCVFVYIKMYQKKILLQLNVHFITIIREDRALDLPWDYFCGFALSHITSIFPIKKKSLETVYVVVDQ